MFNILNKFRKKSGETSSHLNVMPLSLQKKFSFGVQYNMKVIIKGDRNVGKTCLFERLQGNPFVKQYIPTDEIQVASINWSYKNQHDVIKVEVWDVVDKGKQRSKKGELKVHNDEKIISALESTILDAEFLDVYKGTHAVILMTFDYVCCELSSIPTSIPVLIFANHRDENNLRVVSEKEIIDLLSEKCCSKSDHFTKIKWIEGSMLNGFGLKFLYKFLYLPFLYLQQQTLMKQLEINSEEVSLVEEELDYYQQSSDCNYEKFIDYIKSLNQDKSKIKEENSELNDFQKNACSRKDSEDHLNAFHHKESNEIPYANLESHNKLLIKDHDKMYEDKKNLSESLLPAKSDIYREDFHLDESDHIYLDEFLNVETTNILNNFSSQNNNSDSDNENGENPDVLKLEEDFDPNELINPDIFKHY